MTDFDNAPSTNDEGSQDPVLEESLRRLAEEGRGAFDEYCKEHPEEASRLRDDVERLTRHGLVEEFALSDQGDVLLNRFRVQSRAGEGASGLVLLAHDMDLQRAVALKCLRLRAFASDDAARQFQREVRITASLRHPSIVQLLSLEHDDFGSIAVMEFIDGCDLARLTTQWRDHNAESHPSGEHLRAAWRRVSTTEPPSSLGATNYVDWLTHLMIQVAGALHFAHEQGVVHRDVKPSNIMVDHEGSAKLCDFGLASSQSDLSRSRGNGLTGTAAFAAPEQFSGARAHRGMDVFGLGATFYELLRLGNVQRAAEPGGSTAAAPTRTALRHVHEQVERVCFKALQPAPDRRYSDMQAMKEDLLRLVESKKVVATTSFRSRKRRQSVVRAAGVAGLVLLITALSWSVVTLGKERNFDIEETTRLLERAERSLQDTDETSRTAGIDSAAAAERLSQVETLLSLAGERRAELEQTPKLRIRLRALRDAIDTMHRQRRFVLAVDSHLHQPRGGLSTVALRRRTIDGIFAAFDELDIPLAAYAAGSVSETTVEPVLSHSRLKGHFVGTIVKLRPKLLHEGRHQVAEKLTTLLVRMQPRKEELFRGVVQPQTDRDKLAQLLTSVNPKETHPAELASWIQGLIIIDRFEDADRMLAESIRHHPQSYDLKLCRTFVLREQGNHRSIPPIFESLKGSHPNRESAWSGHATIRTPSREASRQASILLDDYLNRFPDSAVANWMSGSSLLRRGEFALAKKRFLEALRHDSEYGPAYRDLANSKINDSPDRRIALLVDACKADPWHALSHHNLADQLFAHPIRSKPQLLRAREAIQRSIELGEQDIPKFKSPLSHHLLADICFALDDFATGFRHYWLSVELPPEQPGNVDDQSFIVHRRLSLAANAAEQSGRSSLAQDLRIRASGLHDASARGAQSGEAKQPPVAIHLTAAWKAHREGNYSAAAEAWEAALQAGLEHSFHALLHTANSYLALAEVQGWNQSARAIDRVCSLLQEALDRISELPNEANTFWIVRIWLSGDHEVARVRFRILTKWVNTPGKMTAQEQRMSELFLRLLAIRKKAQMF